MKIEPYKNTYGYQEVKCPFCDYTAYVRDVTKTNPDPLRDLKRHITNQAKNEALDVALEKTAETPHLSYFREHTSVKRITVSGKRMYDNDLTI